MTDNEIVKALECCTTNGASCKDCPAFVKVDRSNCKQVLLGAIEIINRLQAENESWQAAYMTEKQEIANLEIELKAMRGAANSYKAEIERLKAKCENTQIGYNFAQDDIKTLKKEKYKLQKALNQSEDYRIIAKAEAYKECIEKVKEEIAEALKSNYKARAEREQKIPIYTETEFLSYCSGKIDCLRGIDDFCDNLLKEMEGGASEVED